MTKKKFDLSTVDYSTFRKELLRDARLYEYVHTKYVGSIDVGTTDRRYIRRSVKVLWDFLTKERLEVETNLRKEAALSKYEEYDRTLLRAKVGTSRWTKVFVDGRLVELPSSLEKACTKCKEVTKGVVPLVSTFGLRLSRSKNKSVYKLQSYCKRSRAQKLKESRNAGTK